MSKRGRPKASEVDSRRRAVVDAALAELLEHGYRKTTMLGIANRAGASKETLYAWFGNKQGLFAALIQHQAHGVADGVSRAISSPGSPQEVLERFAFGLLQLLLGAGSVALNRAAMTDLDLAETLLQGGRYTAGPIVEDYLASLGDDGVLGIEDPAIAFESLYGLIMQDLQIRILLNEDPPPVSELKRRATRAIEQFFELYGVR